MAKTNTALAERGGDEEAEVERRFDALSPKVFKTKPRPADVAAFKKLLREHPTAKVWDALNDPMGSAEHSIIEVARGFGVGEGIAAVWRHKLKKLRRELGYQSSPALEQLLIKNVSVCWLRLAIAELTAMSAMEGNFNMKRAVILDGMLTAANKRFTRACETLAKVRKLNLPAVQINVAAEGGRQVNVAG